MNNKSRNIGLKLMRLSFHLFIHSVRLSYDYWYMYNVQSTDYGVGVTGNSRGGHLHCQVLKAP